MCKNYYDNDINTSTEHLKATDWLRLPYICFLFGMIAGVLVMAVLAMIFI
ncbi:hypothetical protein IBL28_12555 [Sinomicrobium sp. FJxs]|uniref:Uncharacterized protein n=1 Tax=Sinomicrobium weinanense TaxID=2842200 RepID=A0A926JSP8_9FLAO|nr:hypothetical protein [Sinomicrobium weinanense]MBC9796805.1 hypothetical protein [Sinomicrobium weinanense]MBU3123691.1 hypothetical protein [Sinomicrobium weinanense]